MFSEILVQLSNKLDIYIYSLIKFVFENFKRYCSFLLLPANARRSLLEYIFINFIRNKLL